MIQDVQDPRLRVSRSPIGGLGVFATVDLPRGSTVLLMSGEVLPWGEILRRIESGVEAVDDPLQIDEDEFVDLAYLPRLINHSCDPNAGIRGRAELVTLRDVVAGEEITYDYSATEGKDSDWTMACACGASLCRRVIGNVSTVPVDRLLAYAAAEGLQDYIRAQCAKELA